MRVASIPLRFVVAALVAATASPVLAQGRLSLAERVERLEQQSRQDATQTPAQTLDLLNRIDELQAEIQSLRALIEQQGFEIESAGKRARDQYIDLDSRLNQLEGGGIAPAAVDPGSVQPGTPDLAQEPPEVRPPLDSGSQTRPVDEIDPASAEFAADPAGERPLYESAFEALKEGRYAESARRFQTFLASYPNGAYAPNAWYWLGESYYVTQNYPTALDAFRQLLSAFPDSAKAPDALLKVGYCQYELRQWSEAEATLGDVVQRYPDTTVSRLAQGRLRALRLEGRN